MLLKFWTRPICHHAILAKLQLRFIPSCPPKMDHRLLILLYIAVLLGRYNTWRSHGRTLLMPSNKFACICMTPVSPILLSSNAFCDISKAPWSTVLLSLAAGRMIWSSTRMSIGQAARIPAALLLGIVCFLAIILYHDRPSANTLSHGPVLRPNIGVLPMLWLRLVGFANSWASFIILYLMLLLSIVATSVPCICQQTRFVTKGPNTWKSISILFGSVWPLALCGFYMFLHSFSMPTYLLRNYQLLSSSTFNPVLMFDHLPVETTGGY